MSTREVTLEGGAPWGFHMHGGLDQNQPLKISRVNPGSKASCKGIREGDVITSVNGRSTKNLTNIEAHAILKNSGDTLTLGLNEDLENSPKRRQYRTVQHQESFQETVKRSTLTTYSSIKTVEKLDSPSDKENNETDKDTTIKSISDHSVHLPPSDLLVTKRPSSSSSSTPTLTKEDLKSYSSENALASQRSSYTNCTLSPSSNSLFSEDGAVPPADETKQTDNMNEGSNRSSRSRKRRHRRRRGHNDKPDNEDYTVQSPTELNAKKTSKPVKSRSLDDEDDGEIKIQEVSGDVDGCQEAQAIVSEASESEVEWEEAENLDIPPPILGALSTLTLPLEGCVSEQIATLSPHEEKTLRSFLEGLNLINGPEEAADRVSDKARKRAELEKYFMPIYQNPRYLEVISEESRESSDRECEPKAGGSGRRNKRKTLPNPVVLVDTKMVEEKEPIYSNLASAEVEVVYLTSSEADSEAESSDSYVLASENHSSNEDLSDKTLVNYETDDTNNAQNLNDTPTTLNVIEDNKETTLTNEHSTKDNNVKGDKETTLTNEQSTKDNNVEDDKETTLTNEQSTKDNNVEGDKETTLTNEHSTKDNNIKDDKGTALTNEQSTKDNNVEDTKVAKLDEFTKNHNTNKELNNTNNNNVILDERLINQLTPPPTPDNHSPEESLMEQLLDSAVKADVITKVLTPPPPSRSPSSSRSSSICTIKQNSSASSIADVMALAKETERFRVVTLREMCVNFLLSLPFGREILEELADVSKCIDSYTSSFLPKVAPEVRELPTNYNSMSCKLSVQSQPGKLPPRKKKQEEITYVKATFNEGQNVDKSAGEVIIPVQVEETPKSGVNDVKVDEDKSSFECNLPREYIIPVETSNGKEEVKTSTAIPIINQVETTKVIKEERNEKKIVNIQEKYQENKTSNEKIKIIKKYRTPVQTEKPKEFIVPIIKEEIDNKTNTKPKEFLIPITKEGHTDKKDMSVPIRKESLKFLQKPKPAATESSTPEQAIKPKEHLIPITRENDKQTYQNWTKTTPKLKEPIHQQDETPMQTDSAPKEHIIPIKLDDDKDTVYQNWTGLRCEEQSESTKQTPREADKLLDLHEKFINRKTSYAQDSRLLTIINEEPNQPPPLRENRLAAKDLTEWLSLARGKSTSLGDLTVRPENSPRSAPDAPRRPSLPQDVFERQLLHIREKEREIERQLQSLEEEKLLLNARMEPFRAEDYCYSRRGDFAESKKRPTSMPVAPTEFFRRQMYEEYMGKFAEREERKQHKIIKVTSCKDLSQEADRREIVHPVHIEEEFMDKVMEMRKGGKLEETKDGSNNDGGEKEVGDEPPVLVIDGETLKSSEQLPKHLQEFVGADGGNAGKKGGKYAKRVSKALSKNRWRSKSSLLHEIDSSLVLAKGFLLQKGIWSPGQKIDLSPKEKDKHFFGNRDESLPPVWTPKSANSSPIAERKEFRPVNFQSPTPSRRNRTASENQPPRRNPDYSSDTGSASSILDRRLPVSRSTPATGFFDFSRLPKAQNPTITLLQKAREGQLPKGASYIEHEPRHFRPKDDRPPTAGPGEILYQIKNEYTSESDNERPRKMTDLSQRKFEGIGPVTKDGIPLVLRSEVKDQNQSKWYKRMYDTIHKQPLHNDEYVTIRYKQKRAQYPYSSGYLSEPEPGSYDSDFAEYKYQTLDRRRPLPQDYVNSTTMPRTIANRSSSSDIYKNQEYLRGPGKIENYVPGRSSIAEKETKQWWDEVMDIFDGHLEQQKQIPHSHPKSFINQCLKDGYESDSTLVFRRKEEAVQRISPKEQREAYKVIQKGGDVPLRGLRKPAPEKPKETDFVEFFPISPTLTRIRLRKNLKPQREIVCYPVTVHHEKAFSSFKRRIPVPPPAPPPSPPKRKSSRNNPTLRLVSSMKEKTAKSPLCKRHQTCFAPASDVDKHKINYLKDKITCKLSPTTSRKQPSTNAKVVKKVTASPEMKSKISSTLVATKDARTSSRRMESKTNILHSVDKGKKSPSVESLKTFGSEKKKFEIDLRSPKLVKSPDLVSPTEVKKAALNLPSCKKTTSKSSKTKPTSTKKTKPVQKLKTKSTKEQINDEIKKEVTSISVLNDIRKQKQAMETNQFFQHLFLRDLPSPTPSNSSRSSWLLEKTNLLHRRRSSFPEPSIGAMKVYLKHTRPVSDSKFISLDLANVRSRSTSPKPMLFEDRMKRSSSLPAKLIFSQTSRPVSPVVQHRKLVSPPLCRSPSCRRIMQYKNAPCKFRELNQFYSEIEKVGQLEKTFSVKPRKKEEAEIIDFDRWREVRARERAEEQLEYLYDSIKKEEKDKGFVYMPKDVSRYRWKKDRDIGLKFKEKSVEDIKEEFERMQEYTKRELEISKDTYKPLWRGFSVANIASSISDRRSHSEGRLQTIRQRLIESEKLLNRGIGSRIWSSLSMEQINLLKDQLAKIYSKEDYSIEVPKEKIKTIVPKLTVRRNSDSSDHFYKKISDISENEKKTISYNLCREAVDKITRSRKDNKLALPIMIGKEVLGAVAAANIKIEEPKKPLIKTNALNTPKALISETESGSTDESTKTVICSTEDIKKKVEYFETVKDKEIYVPTVYKPADDSPEEETPHIPQSKSCQSLKDYFGEKELMKFATIPLSASRKQKFAPKQPQLRSIDISPIRSEISDETRSISPFTNKPPSSTGEVSRLRNKFEYTEDIFGSRTLKRSRSESDLNAIYNVGQVDSIKRKFEFGRGRSRTRRGGVVSPMFLRAEDRFMPHINIISKIASLYSRKSPKTNLERQKSVEELAEILGCPVGEVEKLREKFDSQEDISLMGQMFTSSPNIRELKDIAPYLTADWIAHKYPKFEDNTRSLSSPEASSRNASSLRRDGSRPKSASPSASILKSRSATDFPGNQKHDPIEARYRNGWSVCSKPTVSFKEPEPPVPPVPPPKGLYARKPEESPRKYVENEVTIHYKTPVRQEIKDYLSEDELAHRQAEAMKRIYQEERRRKYLQVSKSVEELQDMNSRRHTDNFIPSQKSPISLNRYDDFDDLAPTARPRPRSPEHRLCARALYNFVGQSARELTFRKGDIIYLRRQIDKNWYEGELNAMVGLFPTNYVEIVPFDGTKSKPTLRKAHEGQARAKYNFVAQTHLELSLAKGELVTITRKVDENWYEGKIGGRKGIFPANYVDILIDPQAAPQPSASTKPVASPAAHSLLLNGSAGGKESMGSHSYTPNSLPNSSQSSYRAKPAQVVNPGLNQALHIETQSEPIPFRAIYKYKPQNEDELELMEGDTVYVLEKCDDGWYVGSSERTGAFGTFPGNYVEKI